MSFATEKQAKGFLKLMKSTMPDNKKQQEIIVGKWPIQSLKRRCSMNALDLCLVQQNGDHQIEEYVNKPTDDIVFHLENVCLYYS